MRANPWVRLLPLAIVLGVALPAFAYRYPLSSVAIREAYFLGTSTSRADKDFLAEYTHTLPEFRVGAYISSVTIETPYFQVARHAASEHNYTAQGAVKDFLGKPTNFIVRVDICRGSSEIGLRNVKVLQNGKEIAPISIEHSPYWVRQAHGPSLAIGST